MRLPGRSTRRFALATASALALAVPGSAALAGAAAAAAAAPRGSGGHEIGLAAQRASRAFWTPARMAAATPVRGAAPAGPAAAAAGPPPGIPSPTPFSGVPTVGALFFTTGSQAHFCTASAVSSRTGNLVLTAAHCVYGSSYASNVAYVPAYHNGQQPYGAWAVSSITVARGWRRSHNPDLDFAFLSVSPPPGSSLPVQQVTGALQLGINLGYRQPIEVIGYNNRENAPIRCATRSFRFAASQLEFYCRDFRNGTSGGPWIARYHAGTGVVFGVIGGYEEGGDYPWASYSAYFGQPTLRLYRQAEQRQAS